MATANCLYCSKDIKYRVGQSLGKYCNNVCQVEHRHIAITDPKVEAGLTSERSVLKKYLIRKHTLKCFECGIKTWRGQPAPIELDHIDGDASNNLPSNLRLLCCNCHGITKTWKGRNKGSGRKARGLDLN